MANFPAIYFKAIGGDKFCDLSISMSLVIAYGKYVVF